MTQDAGLDDVAARLVALRAQAGSPSYAAIAARVGQVRAARGEPDAAPARSTVYDCFRPGRARVDVALVRDVLAALGLGAEETSAWLAAAGLAGAPARWTEAAHGEGLAVGGPALLVGRARERELARRAVVDRDVRVVLVEGMAGVGKSTLARAVAHDLVTAGVAERALHLDVHGSSPSRRPAGPMAVVAAVARHLDVRLPAAADVTAARDALAGNVAGRPVLLVLDDVPAAEHVTVLAQVPGMRVVVTSRHRLRLPGTVPHERVTVRPLATDAAHDLLRAVVGPERVDAEPASAGRLVDALGGLPLALELTARHVAATPAWSLADHADRVAERLGRARVEEAVRAAFHLSYVDLEPRTARTLRLLAAQPCRTLSVREVAVLTGTTTGGAERDVAHLEAVHLVHRDADGVALHDLVRAYAAGVGADADPPSERVEALARLRELWVQRAWAVHHALGGERVRLTSRTRTGWAEVDAQQARAWLDRLTADVLLLVDPATRPDAEQVVELSEALAWAFNQYSRWDTARLLHTQARDVARAAGDEIGVLRATLALGRLSVWRAEWDDATALLTAARRGFERHGVRAQVEDCTQALAIAAAQTGRYDEAAALLRELLDGLVAGGRVRDAGRARDNLAIVLRRLDRLDEAAAEHRRAAAESASTGDREGQGNALVNLSDVLLALGHAADGLATAREALAIGRACGDDRVVAYALTNLGIALDATGDHAAAADHHRQALAQGRRIGDPHLEASVLNNLADTHRALGREDLAAAGYRTAADLAAELQHPHEAARAAAGLAALGLPAGPAHDGSLAADPA